MSSSFYPIFPVPLDVAHEVNLDVTHWEALKLCNGSMDATSPSVLILPSRLKHFCKVSSLLPDHISNIDAYAQQVISGTTVINPSMVSKGSIAFMQYSSQLHNNSIMEVDMIKMT